MGRTIGRAPERIDFMTTPAANPNTSGATCSEIFRVHDALGNWMIEDVRMGRMICMTTRERDAKYIADALRAFDPPNDRIEARRE